MDGRDCESEHRRIDSERRTLDTVRDNVPGQEDNQPELTDTAASSPVAGGPWAMGQKQKAQPYRVQGQGET